MLKKIRTSVRLFFCSVGSFALVCLVSFINGHFVLVFVFVCFDLFVLCFEYLFDFIPFCVNTGNYSSGEFSRPRLMFVQLFPQRQSSRPWSWSCGSRKYNGRCMIAMTNYYVTEIVLIRWKHALCGVVRAREQAHRAIIPRQFSLSRRTCCVKHNGLGHKRL